MKLEGKTLTKEFKPTWKQVENCSKKGSEEKTRSTIHGWRKTRKTSVIMSMIEQIIKTRARKKVRGFPENNQCRLCKNNERQCNVFQLNLKCYQAVNVWQDITEPLWCVCLYPSTVKASSVCIGVLDILEGTEQRSLLRALYQTLVLSPFFPVFQSIIFHLQSQNSGPSKNRKKTI